MPAPVLSWARIAVVTLCHGRDGSGSLCLDVAWMLTWRVASCSANGGAQALSLTMCFSLLESTVGMSGSSLLHQEGSGLSGCACVLEETCVSRGHICARFSWHNRGHLQAFDVTSV